MIVTWQNVETFKGGEHLSTVPNYYIWRRNDDEELRKLKNAAVNQWSRNKRTFFCFILNLGGLRDTSQCERITSAEVSNRNSYRPKCLCVVVCSVNVKWPFVQSAQTKGKVIILRLHSPTTPAGTPWKQPAVRTESHPWLLQWPPAPLTLHQAIINLPINQSIPAAGPWWSSTRDRTKPPLALIRLHELALSLSLSTRYYCLALSRFL